MKADHTIIVRTIDRHIKTLEAFLQIKSLSKEEFKEGNELLIKYRKQRLYFINT